MRVLTTLKCSECGEENYHSSRNKSAQPDRLEVTKYCPRDRKHTLHVEKK